MNNVGGQNPLPEPTMDLSFLNEEFSEIISDRQGQGILETVDEKIKTINKTFSSEVLFFKLEKNNKGPLDAEHLDNKTITQLDPKKHGVVVMLRHDNGDISFLAHESHKNKLEKQGLAIHKRGLDGSDVIENLADRKIVYIGINNAQYQKIFNVANRIISLAAEEYEKNKNKEAEGKNHSLYDRPGSYQKLNTTGKSKKLINQINNSEYARDIKNLRSSQKFSRILARMHEHNKEIREEAQEKIAEKIKEKDLNRDIIKEGINKGNIKTSAEKKENIKHEHPEI